MDKYSLIRQMILCISVYSLVFLTGCKKDQDNAGNNNDNLLYFSFYASRDPIYYNTEKDCAVTGFTIDGSGVGETDSMDIYVEGEKMKRVAYGYSYEKCGRFNDGDSVLVKIVHPKWGEYSFYYLFTDKPDTIYFRPELNDWIKNVGDNNPDNDSIAVLFPKTEYCNYFFGFISRANFTSDTARSEAVCGNNGFFFRNSDADQSWKYIKNKFTAGDELVIFSSFGWQKELVWAKNCKIWANCVSEQAINIVYFPVNIEGTWDMFASYKAINGKYSETVSNATDIMQFNQDGAVFYISTHNNIKGKIEGKTVSFEGDIFTSEGVGGKQYFEGTMQGNTISGNISGTVMAKFPGQSIADVSQLSNGTFTLTKRTK
jgi:hypothetical protein